MSGYHLYCTDCAMYLGMSPQEAHKPRCNACYEVYESNSNHKGKRVSKGKKPPQVVEAVPMKPLQYPGAPASDTLRKTHGVIDKAFYHELEYDVTHERLSLSYEAKMGSLEMSMEMALATKDFEWAHTLHKAMRKLSYLHNTKEGASKT